MALVIKSTLPENVGRVVVIEAITDEQVVMLPTGKRVENPKGLVVCVIEADGLYTRSIWSKEISHGKFGAVPESWLMPLHKASAQSRREEALAA
jgi:hypothetical protein